MTSVRAPSDPEDEGLPAVAGLVDLVSGTLGEARALIQGERRLDLSGLDCDIGVLCARVLDLSPEQGREFRPPLVSLLNELDALTAALKAP